MQIKRIAKWAVVFLALNFLVTPMARAQDHKPFVAGQFYPADSQELKSEVLKYLRASADTVKDPVILIVPHAGYVYSGETAGKAFRSIQGKKYPLVVVIAVAHRWPVRTAVTQLVGSFETPLGKVSIDTESVKYLMSQSPVIESEPRAFVNEHSLEVQLPFLQVALQDFKVIPILMAQPDLKTAASVGNAAASFIREKEKNGIRVLVVVSSDMAHYPNESDCVRSDQAMVDSILKGEPEGLARTSLQLMDQGIPNLKTTMCGEAGALAALYTVEALGYLKSKLIAHTTSASSPYGDSKQTVGYASIVFYRGSDVGKESDKINKTENDMLSQEQKKLLLKLAKDTVESVVRSGKRAPLPSVTDQVLLKPKAVFVTLKKHGLLRGCIGTLTPHLPLIEAVSNYAAAAATEDYRFPPVSTPELGMLSYEVSILSEPVRVPSADAIRPGIDGVTLKKGSRSGVFLPQVWEEAHFTKEQFLSELASQKAGLRPDAWKDADTELYTFQVEAFHD